MPPRRHGRTQLTDQPVAPDRPANLHEPVDGTATTAPTASSTISRRVPRPVLPRSLPNTARLFVKAAARDLKEKVADSRCPTIGAAGRPPLAEEWCSHRLSEGSSPIAGYGVIGDGRTVALVGVDGHIDWWAIPTIDSPPVCAALLDPDGGPAISWWRPGEPADASATYLPGTNILETVCTGRPAGVFG